jgi:hypothetical protein
MIVESLERELVEQTEDLGGNFPIAKISMENVTRSELRSNPGRSAGKPATDQCFIYEGKHIKVIYIFILVSIASGKC